MVRGTEKRIIMLRNPESKLFEEAIFMLREPASLPEIKESDIVEEANRILLAGEAESLASEPKSGKHLGREKLLYFFLGCAVGSLCATLLSLFF